MNAADTTVVRVSVNQHWSAYSHRTYVSTVRWNEENEMNLPLEELEYMAVNYCSDSESFYVLYVH
jgi:hypothetical protein